MGSEEAPSWLDLLGKLWLVPQNNMLINLLVQLDDGFGRINASQCENGTVLCEGLQDGNHKFEVCPNGTQGVGCSSYNWTVGKEPSFYSFSNCYYIFFNYHSTSNKITLLESLQQLCYYVYEEMFCLP